MFSQNQINNILMKKKENPSVFGHFVLYFQGIKLISVAPCCINFKENEILKLQDKLPQ